jgi:hypothetical protein
VSADWLEANVPDYDGPVVLVQGDTGPGNFLYRDGKVTAVLDWELCHWGDPMDDLAWLSLRTVQDTFTHLPDRLAEYAELSGHKIDVERIWYYRVFAETTMATLNARDEDDGAVRDVGNAMIYVQLHRRLWLEALNHGMGLGLTTDAPTLGSRPPSWDPLYGDALAILRTIVPRIDDPLAQRWTKGLARLVQHLRELDTAGREAEAGELADIAALLLDTPSSIEDARIELESANERGAVADADYIRYLWRRVQRDDHLMRHSLGALGQRTWPPLID